MSSDLRAQILVNKSSIGEPVLFLARDPVFEPTKEDKMFLHIQGILADD